MMLSARVGFWLSLFLLIAYITVLATNASFNATVSANLPAQPGPGCQEIYTFDDGRTLWLCDAGVTITPTAVPPTGTVSATPTAGQPTVVPTRTRPPATATAGASATATITPSATFTPMAVSPTPSGHNMLDWHPPAAGHHHGHDPLDTIYADYIAANWTNTIAHPWFSSPAENVLAPDGKHDGFKYLYEENTGCMDRTESGSNCPAAYLFKFHSIGTAHAARVRVHSFRLLVTVCGPGGAPPCGMVEAGGHLDFGLLHDQYKQSVCDIDGNTSYPQDRFQPPYTSINGQRGRPNNAVYWNSVINTLVEPSFQNVPQQHVEIAWFELDPWSVPALGPGCSDPAQDLVISGNNQTAFQTFIIRVNLDRLPAARPFRGFTDVRGNLAPGCIAESLTCVPLYIGQGVPQGDALLFRPVRHGDETHAPILRYGVGADLIMNDYEPGHHNH